MRVRVKVHVHVRVCAQHDTAVVLAPCMCQSSIMCNLSLALSAAAESCAKTCVKLTEMSRLLDELALAKDREGDAAGAKAVLQEREGLRDIIEKNSNKAQANFALAGKLAEKIGEGLAGARAAWCFGAGSGVRCG